MSATALAPLGKQEAKRHPKAATQSPFVQSRTAAGSRALLIHGGGTGEMADLQHITLSRAESPAFIRADIIKRGRVDLKVKCHPQHALDEESFALQKPFKQ